MRLALSRDGSAIYEALEDRLRAGQFGSEEEALAIRTEEERRRREAERGWGFATRRGGGGASAIWRHRTRSQRLGIWCDWPCKEEKRIRRAAKDDMAVAPLQGCWMVFGSPTQGVAAGLVCCAPSGRKTVAA